MAHPTTPRTGRLAPSVISEIPRGGVPVGTRIALKDAAPTPIAPSPRNPVARRATAQPADVHPHPTTDLPASNLSEDARRTSAAIVRRTNRRRTPGRQTPGRRADVLLESLPLESPPLESPRLATAHRARSRRARSRRSAALQIVGPLKTVRRKRRRLTTRPATGHQNSVLFRVARRRRTADLAETSRAETSRAETSRADHPRTSARPAPRHRRRPRFTPTVRSTWRSTTPKTLIYAA